MVEVELRRRARVMRGVARWVRMEAWASEERLTLTIGGDGGSEKAEEMMRVEMEGPLNAPVTLRAEMARRYAVEYSIAGSISGDGRLMGLTIL